MFTVGKQQKLQNFKFIGNDLLMTEMNQIVFFSSQAINTLMEK